MAGIGRPPKPPSKRRRANKPASYGAAEPVTAPAAAAQDRESCVSVSKTRALGIDDPHQLVADMWQVVQTSAEARFYSPADWARLQMELWNANQILTSGKPITGNAWATVQHGLNAMLISPAEKRRAAIELQPPGTDEDADAAVSMIGRYRQSLKPV